MFADRFEGGTCVLDHDEMHAFSTITIANELDIVREAAFDAPTVVLIDTLLAGLGPYAPDAAAVARTEIRDRYDI